MSWITTVNLTTRPAVTVYRIDLDSDDAKVLREYEDYMARAFKIQETLDYKISTNPILTEAVGPDHTQVALIDGTLTEGDFLEVAVEHNIDSPNLHHRLLAVIEDHIVRARRTVSG